MGTDNLPDLAASPTKVDATTTQYNAITNALQGHQVMRDSDGVAEDGVSDIGRPSSGRPDKIYVKTGLNVNGQDIDLDSIALSTTGISSGKSKTSGYPNFLTPEGVTGGATNAVTIEATTTNLVGTIDGEAFTLETDLTSDDLALAPSSNNTAEIDDSNNLFADKNNTKAIGEYGYHIPIDQTGGIGSEISSLNGTVQVFKLVNGSAETEYFIAEIDTTNYKIIPFRRGVGSTDRITFSDTDTITLLKAHYIFLDNDLSTVDTTTTYPTRGPSAPVAPATGDYHYYTTTSINGWYRYSGASWEKLGRIYLGYAICDSADCLAVEHEDFNLGWNNTYSIKKILVDKDNDMIKIDGPIRIGVNNKTIVINSNSTFILTSIVDGEWQYIYVDSDGNFYNSSIIPIRHISGVFYHKDQYYRCIACVYIRSANIINTSVQTGDGFIQFHPSYMSVLGPMTGSASYAKFMANQICPIADTSVLEIDMKNVASQTSYLGFRAPSKTDMENYILMEMDSSTVDRLIHKQECNILESGIIDYKKNQLGSTTVRVYAIRINFK